MRDEHDALAVLHRTLAPSPTWAIEHDLMSIGLADLKYASDASRSVLRRAREKAARLAAPTIPPSASEIQSTLIHGDREARVQLLVRLVLAELEHTIGAQRPQAKEGGTTPPRPEGDGP